MPTRDQILGALYGHLCGDALGVPYEFHSPHRLPAEIVWTGHGTHDQPAGTWSDDGALMLCLVASLLARGELDLADLAARFVQWETAGYLAAGGQVFDIGNTTGLALLRLRDGCPPAEAGPVGERCCGNGSLMRILPLALWYHAAADPTLIELSHLASRVTHGHPLTLVCCAWHTLLAARLLRGVAPELAWTEAHAALGEAYRDDSDLLAALYEVTNFTRPQGKGFVVDTHHTAWRAVLAGDDYVATVTAAVRYGHDTDTTAAVAGGLAGICYGIESIPAAWQSGLRLEPEHRALLADFAVAALARGR